ncbi:MAG: hypothetical protein KAV00_10300 [Phycisphaerae bacterium]|nr:hypothetical protein [Phycisphaerae bacterium]
MAEVEEECIFHTKTDQVKFHTQTNGDTIHIKNLNLSQAQATSMAWLVNADDNVELEFQVKVKGA